MEAPAILLDNCHGRGGYGKLKEKTFRISNTGAETPETMGVTLAALDDAIG